jgi:hypothetical protein
MSTPWEDMKAYLKMLNACVPRSKRWTTSGKDPARQILAMDRTNDPYFAGAPAHVEAAEWFAEFHRRKVGGRRLHLRALFYIATGEDPSPITGEPEAVYLPDGQRFTKSYENWVWFLEAAKDGRNMERVDARHILDRKRSRVFNYASPRERSAPEVQVEGPFLELPDGIISTHANLRRATAQADAIFTSEYAKRDEPSIVEIWTEKDLGEADRPVLENVCSRMRVNLVVGTGVFTISSAYALLERTEHYGLPVRILFLSDFDDAGVHMPISPARHIEFAIRNLNPKPDIALYHLALKPEQIIEQNIPRKIPTTPSEEKTDASRTSRSATAWGPWNSTL